MRPELVVLGPWGYGALPVVIAVVWALALAWLWGEKRWGAGKPLTTTRALIALLVSAALGAVVFSLVNHFGPIHIKAWGTMLVLAFAAGTAVMARSGRRDIITPAECLDFALYCLIGAIIGARVIFVALDWAHYSQEVSRLVNVWEGGLSFHGGLLGAIVAAAVFAARRKKSFPALLDVSAPGLALGYAFARVGCFLNGCCHGHESHLPWAMIFPHGEITNRLVHPTQIYAALSSLAIFFLLLKIRDRFPRPGHLFLAYLAVYSVYRFLIEFTRSGATGKPMPGLPSLTEGQFASVLIFAVAALVIGLTWRVRAVSGQGGVPAEPAGTPPAQKGTTPRKRRP